LVELQEKIQANQEELSHLDRELEDYEGEKGAKYLELRKKEEMVNGEPASLFFQCLNKE
jgi:peptidoglycan hydrolase CwlO-like protein